MNARIDPEAARLQALERLGVLDTPGEALMDSLVRAAAGACGTPMAMIGLIDASRQWIKAQVGLDGLREIAREASLCTVVLQDQGYVEIADTREDPRVRGMATVREAPHLVFYAGAPLRTPDGHVVGTLCVLDRERRPALTAAQRATLADLAGAVMQGLLLRQAAHRTVQASSEHLFRAMSESAPVGIFHTDAQGQCIYTNPQWQEIYGLTFDEALGSGWARGLHPEDRDEVFAEWNRVTGSGGTFDHHFRIARPDGREVHVRARGRAMRLPDGSSGGYVGTIVDISREVAAQERLQRALQGSRLSLWDLDVRTETIYLSESWSELLGGPAEESTCTARELLSLVPQEDLPRIEQALGAVWRGESKQYLVRHRVRRRDGTLLWIHSEGRVAEEDARGMPLRMVGTNRDITQTVRAEEQLRAARDEADAANRAKTQFLATMSHEIRTPLNGIIGMTKLVLDEPLAPQVRHHVHLVDRSAHALLALVNDILDVSKIEAGQMEIENAPFDLHELVDELARLYRLRASEKSLLFKLHVDPQVPRHLNGDAARVRQVLVNLLGNALKFTETGWIALDVHGAPGADGRCTLEFTVADSGIGIAQEVHPRLFTRFMQADSSTSRRFGGSGLGLAIVRQLVELMGGSVSFTSAPAQGSRFTVKLPLACSDAPLAAASIWSELPRPAPSTRVLVAEDNSTNQVVAFGMLHKLGYEDVSLANDGIQAYEMAVGNGFDLILMDCQMPEMDGYEATRRLRAAGCTAAIIAMTANAIKGDRERCLEAGMNDYLAKPIDLNQLGGMLARWAPAQGVERPSQAGELPVFAPQAMHVRFGGDTELEQVALASFRNATPPLLGKLQAAIDAGNRAQIGLLAHSAKGAGSMVCAQRYAALAATLEQRAPSAPFEVLGRIAADLQRAWEEFAAALDAAA